MNIQQWCRHCLRTTCGDGPPGSEAPGATGDTSCAVGEACCSGGAASPALALPPPVALPQRPSRAAAPLAAAAVLPPPAAAGSAAPAATGPLLSGEAPGHVRCRVMTTEDQHCNREFGSPLSNIDGWLVHDVMHLAMQDQQ